MTETRTTRFELPSYSADSDGPSRSDWQDLATHLEARAAYDDGVPVSTLPITGLHAGRYFWQVQQPGGGATPTYRTLWRSDGSALYPVGGPVVTTTQLYRGLHSSVSGSAANEVIRIEHASNPDDGGWGGHITYAGAAYLRTGLALGDDDDTTVGRLAVGAPALPGSGVRVSVDSYGSGEHVIVARARHGTPGNLFRGLNSGGSVVFSVDGIGQVAAPSPSAFGGASPNAVASLAVAPTSGAGGVTQGLMLYGLTASGDADDVNKALLRGYPDLADTTAILSVNRLNMQFGRITWGTPGTADSGTLRFDANSATFRTYGGATGAGRAYWAWRRASAVTPDDTAQDTLLADITTNRFHSALPLVVSQRQKQSASTFTLQRVGDFSSTFLDAYRIVPDGGGGETTQLAGSWASDGRLRTGAWWRSVGTIRDARQSIHHVSTKVWAQPSDNYLTGIHVVPNSDYSYTFGEMTVRSDGTADLIIGLNAEFSFEFHDFAGQRYYFECYVSLNGGTYNKVDLTEQNASTTDNFTGGAIAVGYRMMSQFILSSTTSGDTFQVRIKFKCYDGPDVYLRKYRIDVQESLVETYAAPA